MLYWFVKLIHCFTYSCCIVPNNDHIVHINQVCNKILPLLCIKWKASAFYYSKFNRVNDIIKYGTSYVSHVEVHKETFLIYKLLYFFPLQNLLVFSCILPYRSRSTCRKALLMSKWWMIQSFFVLIASKVLLQVHHGRQHFSFV